MKMDTAEWDCGVAEALSRNIPWVTEQNEEPFQFGLSSVGSSGE
jgi:hypothetical protein